MRKKSEAATMGGSSPPGAHCSNGLLDGSAIFRRQLGPRPAAFQPLCALLRRQGSVFTLYNGAPVKLNIQRVARFELSAFAEFGRDAGDPGEIELACENLAVGWQDEQALYLHRSLLEELPPGLRAYLGCATSLFGDVSQADVIKLHKSSGKATFLAYDDFEGKALPVLNHRIKVNLRTRWVQVFDHSKDGQLLYFKERFVGADHPQRGAMETFSKRLRKVGFDDACIGRGPRRSEFQSFLLAKGLNENLNPRRSARG